MDCEECREALSARLDDELGERERQAVDAHLQACAGCAAHAEQLAELTRLTRVQPAAQVPDLAPAVLARLQPGPRRDPEPRGVRAWSWLRAALAALAMVQLGLALPDLVASGHVHAAREAASWQVALAVGFFAVAWRPAWVVGLVPVLTAAVVGLAVTAGLDVAAGHTSLAGEAPHAVKLAGLALVWTLAHRLPRAAPQRAVG